MEILGFLLFTAILHEPTQKRLNRAYLALIGSNDDDPGKRG